MLLLLLPLFTDEGSRGDIETSPSSSRAAPVLKVVSFDKASSDKASEFASALKELLSGRLSRGDGAGDTHGEITTSAPAAVPIS
jgi:hypothetical protein